MNVQQLIDTNLFTCIVAGNNLEQNISKCYCCDLLSMVLKNAPADCAWFTVMSNLNTLAVSSLADISCVIITDGVAVDEAMREKALSHGITLLSTKEPAFDAGLSLHSLLVAS